MKLVAGVVVKKDKKFLLVQEKLPKAYGLWNFPAGHVDSGEKLQETAKREAREETGLDLEVGKEVFVFNDGYAEIHIFEANLMSGELKWDPNELLNVSWFTAKEVQGLSLRHQEYKELLK